MLLKRRTGYHILAEIVEHSEELATITDLFYKTETSFKGLKRFINVALDLKLIEQVSLQKRKHPYCHYRCTAKGKEWLALWRRQEELLNM